MAPEIQAAERYATQVGELWHELSHTLARLEGIAATPDLLDEDAYAARLLTWLREHGLDWPGDRVRATVPLVQVKLEKLSQYPDYVRFLFEPVSPDGADPGISRAAAEALRGVEPWNAAGIEEALRGFAEAQGLKPREAFAPIRLAVTGSKVSPSLFESLELLGKEESLARLAATGGT